MSQKFVKVAELKPGMRHINVVIRILKVGDTRNFRTRDGIMHSVQELLVGDETGVILASAWDLHVGKFSEGGTYVLKNAFTSVYRRSLRLGIGRHTSVEKSSSEIPEGSIKRDNNISEKEVKWVSRRRSFRRGNNKTRRK